MDSQQPSFRIAPMEAHHLSALEQIEREVYRASLVEPIAVHAARRDLAPQWCFVALNAADDVLGFIVAHPWSRASWPALGSVLDALPDDASCVHIHDCAVSERGRGLGIAQAFMERITQQCRADQREQIHLVAVDGADGYWSRLGFVIEPSLKPAYGDRAFFMTREI